MSDVVFVDTNVLVYARDSSEAVKQPRAAAWMRRLWQERRGRLSMQVLQEYYVTVTHKLRPGLSGEAAQADVRLLNAWDPVPADFGLVQDAWELEERYGFSFWDALIVAAAQRSRAQYLLSEDLQAGQAVGAMTIIDPFQTDPAEI